MADCGAADRARAIAGSRPGDADVAWLTGALLDSIRALDAMAVLAPGGPDCGCEEHSVLRAWLDRYCEGWGEG